MAVDESPPARAREEPPPRTGSEEPPAGASRRGRWIAAALVAGLALASAGVRVHLALSDPGFDPVRRERLLKSDPALLVYVTERILAAGGGVPADFRADPRIEHPEPSDLAAMLTVGQEFVTAWAWAALGRPGALHVFCVWLWAAVASLAVVGVFGAAREVTGRLGPALLAAALWAAAPASYRTAGVILIREDLSLPLFALHAWLVLRAARVATPAAWALAGVPLLAALATWHAMGFVVAVEVACALAWGLATGRSALRARGAWALPAVVALGALAVPVLRAKGIWLSLPAVLAAGLGAQALADRWPRAARTGAALAAVAALAGVARALAAAGVLADYTHVYELAAAKLATLGVRPADPTAVSFGARLLWQGPFETASIRELIAGASVAVVLLPVAILGPLPVAWRARDGRVAGVVAFALASAVLAWAVRRNLAVASLALPVAAALVVARLPRRQAPAWLAGLALAQLVAAVGVLPHRTLRWYFPLHQDELAAAIRFVDAELPPGACVAADFVNGPGVLAATGRSMVLQPKYETRRSRERTRRFLEALFHGTLGDLRALLAEWRCGHLLVDRQTLWQMRWMAGLPESLAEPVPGTAAAALLATDAARLAAIPGFRLRYRSALPGDLMRVFEVR